MIDMVVGLSLRIKKKKKNHSYGEYPQRIASPELSKFIDNDFANSRDRWRGRESYTVRVSGYVLE